MTSTVLVVTVIFLAATAADCQLTPELCFTFSSFTPLNTYCLQIASTLSVSSPLQEIEAFCRRNSTFGSSCAQVAGQVLYNCGDVANATLIEQGCVAVQNPIQLIKGDEVPIECHNRLTGEDSSLQQCSQMAINALSPFVTDPAVVTNFCTNGDCPRRAATVLANCGLVEFAQFVQTGCSQDQQNRYCGIVVNPSKNPGVNALFTAVGIACGTSGCDTTCRTAVDNVGCCAASIEGFIDDFISQAVARCNVESCPVPFSLPGSAANAIQVVPLLSMLLAFLAILMY